MKNINFVSPFLLKTDDNKFSSSFHISSSISHRTLRGWQLEGVDKHLEASHLLNAVAVEGDLDDIAGGHKGHPRGRQLVAAHLDTEVFLKSFNLYVVINAFIRMLHLQCFK